MVRAMPTIHAPDGFSPSLLGLGLFISVSVLVSLCAKHARKQTPNQNPAKTPFPSAKQVITTLSQKAMMVNARKPPPNSGVDHKTGDEQSGVWQKAILMGEKCQPPEFSGVIYYDYSGNRVPEMPKSPRHTPLTPLRSFNPIIENGMY